jgi:cell fate regulator YaaT (PSP1 superfamily)
MNSNNTLYAPRGVRIGTGGNDETSWQQCAGCQKLHASDTFCSMHNAALPNDIVEVRFKHTRKDFFKTGGILLHAGDAVAVEASSRHDIGLVSLTGDSAYKQMLRYGLNPHTHTFKKIFRKAKAYDIVKWNAVFAQEQPMMVRARQIAQELGLCMKITDVEIFGDRSRAIFYYTADDRVDFRELIKVMYEAFNLNIEMKQIGERQEAARLGGIGSCGRELCCSSFMSRFAVVNPNALRDQDITANPKKLTGHCGRTKCCLNFEHCVYVDARKDFPDAPTLETADGTAYLTKTDTFKRTMYYHYPENPDALTALTIEQVSEIAAANKRGEKPPLSGKDKLSKPIAEDKTAMGCNADDTDITRFDAVRRKHAERRRHGGRQQRHT